MAVKSGFKQSKVSVSLAPKARMCNHQIISMLQKHLAKTQNCEISLHAIDKDYIRQYCRMTNMTNDSVRFSHHDPQPDGNR